MVKRRKYVLLTRVFTTPADRMAVYDKLSRKRRDEEKCENFPKDKFFMYTDRMVAPTSQQERIP